MAEKTITISIEQYRELVKASTFLNCLEECGVHNWDGYDYAQDLLNADEEEE